MAGNLFELDLSRFTQADHQKLRALGDRLKLMRRWYRYEITRKPEGEEAQLYSGNRGPVRYAHYRVQRRRNGTYVLMSGSSDTVLHDSRTIAAVLEAIPNDFFYS